MEFSGNILKMQSALNDVVHYQLPIGDKKISVNNLIGKEIEVEFTGQINCIKCGRQTKKSFGQGFCFPCFKTAPEADPAIIKPELDMAHEGISRDMEWAKTHSLIDHYVYLSYSGNLKVGVTRHTQIPTRWIDQGAVLGITIAKTPHRNMAGQIEVFLKKHFADKTNWRKMLKNVDYSDVNMKSEKQKAVDLLVNTEFEEYLLDEDKTIEKEIKFPVEEYPDKIKSINLDKNPTFSKTLKGIKGQYLIFNDNNVINIRKYNGYYLNVKY